MESPSARLEKLLGYGRFQKFQVWGYASLICFVGAMCLFQLGFTVTRKPFRCRLPYDLEQNFDFHSFDNTSLFEDSCTMASFKMSSERCQEAAIKHITNPEDLAQSGCFDIEQQLPCEFGYLHDTSASDAFFSLSAENDWICDKEELGSNLLFAQGIGFIVNSLLFMQLSDTLLMLIFYHRYYILLFVTAIGSAFYPIGIRVGYIVVAEYTDDHGRLQLYIAGWIWWVVGVAGLSLIAWLTGDWFYYGIATSFLNIALIPFYWLSPESPRLRLTQGRVQEASRIIRTIKKVNRDHIDADLDDQLEDIAREISKEKKPGVWSLFTSLRMAWIVFLLCLTWTANDFFYLGGQLNVENLAGNQFVNFAAVAFTELPSVFIGEYMMNRIGRRWSHVLCMIMATVFFGAIIPIAQDESLGWLVTTLAIAAKTASNVGWFINYVQTVELFPTSARVSGMTFCSTTAAVIGLTAPYVILLGTYDIRLMYVIFTVMGVLGILSASCLPESHKQEFPECVEDIEKRPQHPFFSWKVWEKET